MPILIYQAFQRLLPSREKGVDAFLHRPPVNSFLFSLRLNMASFRHQQRFASCDALTHVPMLYRITLAIQYPDACAAASVGFDPASQSV